MFLGFFNSFSVLVADAQTCAGSVFIGCSPFGLHIRLRLVYRGLYLIFKNVESFLLLYQDHFDIEEEQLIGLRHGTY